VPSAVTTPLGSIRAILSVTSSTLGRFSAPSQTPLSSTARLPPIGYSGTTFGSRSGRSATWACSAWAHSSRSMAFSGPTAPVGPFQAGSAFTIGRKPSVDIQNRKKRYHLS
jgi:hypothetical protein